MYSELIKRLRWMAELEADEIGESKWERFEWQAADALESQAKELAARELVIQQSNNLLKSCCSHMIRSEEADSLSIEAASIYTEQPSTTYLDAYVAEKVKEKDAEIEQWKCNSRENKLIAEQCERRNLAQAEALKNIKELAGPIAHNSTDDARGMAYQIIAAINALEK